VKEGLLRVEVVIRTESTATVFDKVIVAKGTIPVVEHVRIGKRLKLVYGCSPTAKAGF
jgi:hypothetical protein